MTTTRTGLRANQITRTLRAEGHTILPAETPRSRQGTRVSQGHNDRTVTIAADFDVETMGARRIAEIRRTLAGLGYTVEVNPHTATILTVTRAR